MYLKIISQITNGTDITSSQRCFHKIAGLKKLASIFNTSVDYIIEYTDIRQPIDKIAQSKLSETECELLNEFRCLPKEKQNIALGIIMGLKHS